jgi:hypothetical protein
VGKTSRSKSNLEWVVRKLVVEAAYDANFRYGSDAKKDMSEYFLWAIAFCLDT